MCGPSGAGKTTYARGLEEAGWARLSFDSHLWARGIRSGDVDPAVREEIRLLLRDELRELVDGGRDVVLDCSFWSRAMRDEWRELLGEQEIEPETIHLATADGYLDRFEAPTREEGPLGPPRRPARAVDPQLPRMIDPSTGYIEEDR